MDLSQFSLDERSYAELNAAMNIFDEAKFKKALIAISRKSAEVVGATIGPFARTVIIGDGYTHYPSKDGWSVLKKLTFNGDSTYGELFGIFKDVSYALASKVGDGTSTAVVAADAFINEMINGKYSEEISKFSQATFVNKLNELVAEITKELEEDASHHRIDRNGDFSDLKRIAMISSNGNEELSEIIRKIYAETCNPNIYVSIGNTDHLEYTVEKGYRLSGSAIAHRAYINNDEGTFKTTSPVCIAIFDHNVNWDTHEKLIGALRALAMKRKQKLLIVAPTYDDLTATALKAVVDQQAAMGQQPDICVFTAPVSMGHMRKALSDFGILLGANLIDFTRVTAYNNRVYREQGGDDNVELKETVYDKLDEFKQLSSWDLLSQCLGVSIDTTVGEDYILIRDYNTESIEAIQAFKEAKSDYETAKAKMDKAMAGNDTEYLRALNRYNRLTGSMGTITVGASSSLSQKCLRDSVDDAVLACKSAYEYGYVKGLNVSCLQAINIVLERATAHDDTMGTLILKVLKSAIEAASLKVLANKYEDVDAPIHELNNEYNCRDIVRHCVMGNQVFNLVTDSFENENDTKVIQSVRTDIEVLNALSSILGLILTSSYMISTNQGFNRKELERLEEESRLDEFTKKMSIVKDKLYPNNTITPILDIAQPINPLNLSDTWPCGPTCETNIVKYEDD